MHADTNSIHLHPRSSACICGRFLDEQFEKRHLLWLVSDALRMPLHTEKQRKARIFYAFDDSIRRFADDAQSLAYIFDGLLVTGVYIDLGFSDHSRRKRLGIERNLMPVRWPAACAIATGISTFLSMFDRAGPIEIR